MRIAIFLLAAVLALPSPALAAFKPTTVDELDIRRAEIYINSRQKIAAKFIQSTDDGQTVTGTLLIKRPGKMNITYDRPLKDTIIADGSFIYMWDGEMENSTTIPMGESLADLILRANLKLSGDVLVTNVQRRANIIEISVAQTSDPGNGTMTLMFEDRPFILHGWRIEDAQGRITTIALQGLQENVEIPERSFVVVSPKFGKSVRTDKPINN